MASSQKLSEIADRACFLNHNFFHRHRTMDWLKLYVLFYDFIVLEERYTVNIGSELVFKYSEIWSKLKKSVIYLEDSGSRPDRDVRSCAGGPVT